MGIGNIRTYLDDSLEGIKWRWEPNIVKGNDDMLIVSSELMDIINKNNELPSELSEEINIKFGKFTPTKTKQEEKQKAKKPENSVVTSNDCESLKAIPSVLSFFISSPIWILYAIIGTGFKFGDRIVDWMWGE